MPQVEISPVQTLKQATTKMTPRNAVPTGPNAECERFVSTVAPVSVAGSTGVIEPETMPMKASAP